MVRKAAEFAAKGMLKQKQETDADKKPEIQWKPGDLDFEAYMRLLDSAVWFFYCQLF